MPPTRQNAGEDADIRLGRMGRAPEERGINAELRGDGGYDARYMFSHLKSFGIAKIRDDEPSTLAVHAVA